MSAQKSQTQKHYILETYTLCIIYPFKYIHYIYNNIYVCTYKIYIYIYNDIYI